MINADKSVADVKNITATASQTVSRADHLLANSSKDIQEAIGSLNNTVRNMETFMAEGTGLVRSADGGNSAALIDNASES